MQVLCLLNFVSTFENCGILCTVDAMFKRAGIPSSRETSTYSACLLEVNKSDGLSYFF